MLLRIGKRQDNLLDRATVMTANAGNGDRQCHLFVPDRKHLERPGGLTESDHPATTAVGAFYGVRMNGRMQDCTAALKNGFEVLHLVDSEQMIQVTGGNSFTLQIEDVFFLLL